MEILWWEEILHQLIGSLSHYLQGFIHLNWCRISSINSMTLLITIQGPILWLVKFPGSRCDLCHGKPWNDACNWVGFHPLTLTTKVILLGGGNSNICLFSPLFGEDSQFDKYFSNGLKPPTIDCVFLPPILGKMRWSTVNHSFFSNGLKLPTLEKHVSFRRC